ncbi:MAG: phage scaffolding protein [Clostridiales bacterium]|jgi:hypothetical protein|nr:phage scaffolding protein [Clostridiales bacterium]
MHRDELKALGLEKDVIDKIMELNGVDINAAKKAIETERDKEKNRADGLQQKINDIEPLAKDNEAVKKELNDLKGEQKKAAEQAKADGADKALTDSIKAVFGDKKFVNDYTRDAVIAAAATEST